MNLALYKTRTDYWFEIWENIRKLFQISLIIFVGAGNSLQIVAEMVITLISVVVLHVARPYVLQANLILALIAQWSIFAMSLVALLIKLDQAAATPAFNEQAMGDMLIVIFLCTPVIGGSQMIVAIITKRWFIRTPWFKGQDDDSENNLGPTRGTSQNMHYENAKRGPRRKSILELFRGPATSRNVSDNPVFDNDHGVLLSDDENAQEFENFWALSGQKKQKIYALFLQAKQDLAKVKSNEHVIASLLKKQDELEKTKIEFAKNQDELSKAHEKLERAAAAANGAVLAPRRPSGFPFLFHWRNDIPEKHPSFGRQRSVSLNVFPNHKEQKRQQDVLFDRSKPASVIARLEMRNLKRKPSIPRNDDGNDGDVDQSWIHDRARQEFVTGLFLKRNDRDEDA